MIIDNSFEVGMAPGRALDVLTDVPLVAPCIPGVTLTEVLGGDSYRGTAAVRLGPVALAFAGTARLVAIDREAGTVRVEAEGADEKGRGRARANVTFALSPAGPGTRVDVRSEVTLTGQVAQYGRASGLIGEVANQIIGDFTRNLAAKLAADAPRSGPAAAPPTGRKQEISGLRVLLRAIWAMIARLLHRPDRR